MISRSKFDKYPETPIVLYQVTEELYGRVKEYQSMLNKTLEPFHVMANLFGSVALGIPGKNEFEFKICADDHNWEQLRELLERTYGPPVRVKHDRIRFEECRDGQEVEILLVRGDEVAKDQWMMEKLSEPTHREAYVAVKEKYSYSEREYIYQKTLFFEELLQQRPVSAERLMQRSDYSFGIIPVRYNQDSQPEYLLIKHQIGHWGFPKGHAEGGETAHQAAYRELNEEVGLSVVRLLSYGPINENYTYTRGVEIINREIQYWPALVIGDVVLQEIEVQEYAWLSYDKAHQLLEYKENKETLLNARKIVNSIISLHN